MTSYNEFVRLALCRIHSKLDCIFLQIYISESPSLTDMKPKMQIVQCITSSEDPKAIHLTYEL